VKKPGNMDYVNVFIYDGCNSGPGQDDGVNALRLMGWSLHQSAPKQSDHEWCSCQRRNNTLYSTPDWMPQRPESRPDNWIIISGIK